MELTLGFRNIHLHQLNFFSLSDKSQLTWAKSMNVKLNFFSLSHKSELTWANLMSVLPAFFRPILIRLHPFSPLLSMLLPMPPPPIPLGTVVAACPAGGDGEA